MATADEYGYLDEREENELHKSRLLNVEEKPFKRILKQMSRLTNPNLQKLPTPPPDATADAQDGQDGAAPDPTTLKEDIALDFAAFDAAITRLQFLATANAAERERYQRDRTRILDTMESVRENNGVLRAQLDEARATLAQRKRFDELADRITSNRMLRTRAEQDVNLAKLFEECEELQRESETYGVTWRERKEQFDKLVDEGVNLRRLIRDEKEEVERREGMDNEDGDEEADGTPGKSGGVGGGSQSGNVTPRPGSSSGRTPRPDSPGAGVGDSLKPRPDATGGFSRGGSLAPSVRTAGSPRPDSQAPKDDEPEEGEDVEMGEPAPTVNTPMAEGSADETPQITVDAPAASGDKMDTT